MLSNAFRREVIIIAAFKKEDALRERYEALTRRGAAIYLAHSTLHS